MRLWSFHPQYLDRQGLVGQWKECCQAQTVLTRKKGYYNHSGLQRFKVYPDPLKLIGFYMGEVWIEATKRKYSFNFDLIKNPLSIDMIGVYVPVTKGQLKYEWQFYLSKIKVRSIELYKGLSLIEIPDIHPLFTLVDGPVEDWEKVKY